MNTSSGNYLILNILFFFSFLFIIVNAEDSHNHNHAVVTDFQEGRHYHNISPSIPTDVEDGKVEVTEVFWYGCPHCFDFESYLETWKETLPEHVTFKRMPAVLNRGWVAHARAFYALDTMGELDRIHPIFFEAIHTQGRRLRDKDSMVRFLSQHGIDAEKFKNAYDSMYVETKIKRVDQVVRQYGVSSVPQVVVNGKYRTSASDAGGYENLLRVVDMLVEKETSAMNAVSASEAN